MRISALLLLAALPLAAQRSDDVNYDEARVPKYTLPDPLVLQNGRRVTDARSWNEKRRPELLELFRTEMYGRRPGKPEHVSYELTSVDKQALGGKAVRKEATVFFTGKKDGPQMNILIYLPAAASRPVPLFLGLNFGPNQTVNADPGIRLRDAWVRSGSTKILVKKPATEESRGTAAGRWQVEKIVGAGYGLAVIYYGDIEPDFDGGAAYGVRALYAPAGADGWAAIGAWAWGLSRAQFKPGLPKRLFSTDIEHDSLTRQYDVSADGRRFLVVQPVEQSTAEPLTVILNWQTLLKK